MAAGGGGASSKSDTGNASGNNRQDNQETDSQSENTAMGRYVEKIFDLSGSISGYGTSICMLEDEKLVLADAGNDFLITNDNGETWVTDIREWKTQIEEGGGYIKALAVGRDNTVGVIYDMTNQDPSAEDYNPFIENLEVMIVKPDGTQIPVQMNLAAEDEIMQKIWISDSGRIFVNTYGAAPNLYEIKEDGSSERFLELESDATLVQFQNELMIIDGYDYDGLLLYDMEKEEYIEDEILDDFIEENYKNRSANGGSAYDLYFFMGEENVLYLAGRKGLHRHVIGGSAIEQVIDGSLSIFNNPSCKLRNMVMLNNSEFMALFVGSKLVRFTYNPDIPTVPDERLKVYSLHDNNTVRAAMTLYQTIYPSVFIEYEIGMEEGSSVTREDALKNLNTKIAAGEGADIFILDNMPADSYIEKGLLMDLSPILENINEEDALFENIVEAFRIEDKIYEIPCEIQLPAVFGKEIYTSGMTDLEAIADAMERLREDNPAKDLCGFCTEDSIMKLFSMISVPEWKAQGGGLDREALTDYLIQMKRIYDIQMSGISDEVVQRYYDLSEMYREIYGYSLDESPAWIRMGINYIDCIMGLRQLAFGTLEGDFTYAVMSSMEKMEGYEDCKLVLMNPALFYPQTLTAISAVSENKEQAESFLCCLLGKENQSSLFNGLAINKAAFDNIRTEAEAVEEDEVYSDMGMMDEDGNIVALIVYYPEEEDIQRLQNWIESVSVPYIEDDLLENAVYEEGAAYLTGAQTLENALERIEKRVALYMAE